jgi:hypothetical protein
MWSMKILILTTSATQKAVIRHTTKFCVPWNLYGQKRLTVSRRTSLSELLHIVFKKLQLFSNSRFVNSRWLAGRSLLFCLYARLFVLRSDRVKNLLSWHHKSPATKLRLKAFIYSPLFNYLTSELLSLFACRYTKRKRQTLTTTHIYLSNKIDV